MKPCGIGRVLLSEDTKADIEPLFQSFIFEGIGKS